MTGPSARRPRARRPSSGGKVFKGVLTERPYPPPGLTAGDWGRLAPRQVLLAELITVKAELRLDVLLDEDSTFFGDLFCHVVDWQDELYLEDGLHRAVQAALHQRAALHVRIARLAADGSWLGPEA
ncbi:MAG: hypothetical protein JWN87_2665 [Frankiales bacterium]|nr:hypothetical protein [Frankiales bacterium]